MIEQVFERVSVPACRHPHSLTTHAGGESEWQMPDGNRFRIIDVDGLGDEAVIVRRQPVGLLLIDSAMSCEDRIDILEQAMGMDDPVSN